MDMYKPGYLGKVIPADDTTKLKKFINTQFDAFCSIYDCCKNHSNEINDIKTHESTIDEESSILCVEIITNAETLSMLSTHINNIENSALSINGNVITAK